MNFESWAIGKCCAFLALSVYLALGQVPMHAQTPAANGALPSEYQVKAAFLINFIRFTEWPPAITAATAPFTICVLGSDPLGDELSQMVSGETFEHRRLQVQRVIRPNEACQVLYIDNTETDVATVLRGVGSGVLTVGEGPRFLDAGGMIGFVVENRRVRFDINQRAATERSLQISSRLLGVARMVRTKQQ